MLSTEMPSPVPWTVSPNHSLPWRDYPLVGPRSFRAIAAAAAVAGSACSSPAREEIDPAVAGDTSGESGSGVSAGETVASGDDSTGSGPAESGSTSNTPFKLDVASPETGADNSGCTKIDFLFVVDDSGSMSDEQQNLAQSFPGFISTIETATETDDYHVMVVDTSEGPIASGVSCSETECECTFSPLPNDHPCCFAACAGAFNLDIETCDGLSCENFPYPQGCDVVRGAGRNTNHMYEPCNFASGTRFMDSTESDLGASFACAAVVGINSTDERPMDAMIQALGPLQEPGACNEGFLRDDAILVVTVITDEDDVASMGTSADWKQALVEAKLGDEKAVVVLGLIGDPDLPNPVCDPAGSAGSGGADPAMNIRTFVQSLENGLLGSVCLPDYSDFFANAVSLVKVTCDEFEPAG